MDYLEAIEILRRGNKLGVDEDEAVNVISIEIAAGNDLELTLTRLVNELLNSRNPSFSHQVIWAIIISGNEKIADSFALQNLFINETLGSTSVKDGLLKCMAALAACTKVVGD